MKNFMNFKEFSVNERSDWDNSDWDSYYGKTRDTKLGKTLQDISNDIRQETRKTGDEELNAPAWLLAKGVSSLFNLGASIADAGRRRKKKDNSEEDKKEDKREEKEKDKKLRIEREWEEFVRDSEKKGIARFGKDWSLLNPKTEEEKKYSESVRRREREMIARMIK
jgi:hypothetical protein